MNLQKINLATEALQKLYGKISPWESSQGKMITGGLKSGASSEEREIAIGAMKNQSPGNPLMQMAMGVSLPSGAANPAFQKLIQERNELGKLYQNLTRKSGTVENISKEIARFSGQDITDLPSTYSTNPMLKEEGGKLVQAVVKRLGEIKQSIYALGLDEIGRPLSSLRK